VLGHLLQELQQEELVLLHLLQEHLLLMQVVAVVVNQEHQLLLEVVAEVVQVAHQIQFQAHLAHQIQVAVEVVEAQLLE
jgi:hypothetical protein